MSHISYQNFIRFSAANLLRAGICANSSAESAIRAKEIYGKNSRGEWKSVQRDAKKLLKLAEDHGLTFERPYKVIDSIVWGLSFDSFIPMFGLSHRSSKSGFCKLPRSVN